MIYNKQQKIKFYIFITHWRPTISNSYHTLQGGDILHLFYRLEKLGEERLHQDNTAFFNRNKAFFALFHASLHHASIIVPLISMKLNLIVSQHFDIKVINIKNFWNNLY